MLKPELVLSERFLCNLRASRSFDHIRKVAVIVMRVKKTISVQITIDTTSN